MSSQPADQAQHPHPLPLRIEVLILIVAIVAGAWLRGTSLFAIGLSHHDEAVYAITSMVPAPTFSELFKAMVDQGLYSPPGFALLSRVACAILGGPTEYGVLVTSWLFGCLTIPLVWWIGRAWWNQVVGLTAACVVAVDGVAIAFSRIGLTDATFAWCYLTTLWVARDAIRPERGWRWPIAAGLLGGFTWNIKVNGFLPVFLTLGYVSDLRQLRRLVIIGGLAFACYVPWMTLFHVKHPGGYPAMVAHHRGYFQGPTAVLHNWQTAISSYAALQSLAPAIPMLAACLILGRSNWPRAFALVSAIALGFVSPSAPLIVLLLAFAAVALESEAADRCGLVWTLAWLLFLPAMYTPYFRLWLPTVLLVHLFAVAGIHTLLTAKAAEHSSRFANGWVALLLLLGVSLACFQGVRVSKWSPVPDANAGYRPASETIATVLSERKNTRVFALARPPLRLYLAAQEVPIQYLTGNSVPTMRRGDLLILDGPLVDNQKEFKTQVEASIRSGDLREVQDVPVDFSLPTWLDDHPGGAGNPHRPSVRVLEYRR